MEQQLAGNEADLAEESLNRPQARPNRARDRIERHIEHAEAFAEQLMPTPHGLPQPRSSISGSGGGFLGW